MRFLCRLAVRRFGLAHGLHTRGIGTMNSVQPMIAEVAAADRFDVLTDKAGVVWGRVCERAWRSIADCARRGLS